MRDGTKTASSSRSDQPQVSQAVRDWLDVIAKLIGALAIACVTWVGYNYQSKASLSSIINQREQAESQLRASMLSDLVEPIMGKNGAASGDADPERQRLLAEMVTLNFHDHFEFKPLLLEVDANLLKAGDKGMAGHKKLASDARRIIDRQINMLTSIDGISRNGDGYSAKVTRIDLVNSETTPYTTSPGNCTTEGDIRVRTPSMADAENKTLICVTSPDNKVCLLIRFFPPNYVDKSLAIGTKIIFPDRQRPSQSWFWPLRDRTASTARCNPQMDEITRPQEDVRQSDETHLSLFDFPLTDNAKIMWGGNEYRYSVSIYELTDPGNLITLKLVWFPQGYVTERERPTNPSQFARFLR
jgi:hypothetical protein